MLSLNPNNIETLRMLEQIPDTPVPIAKNVINDSGNLGVFDHYTIKFA